MFQHQKTRACSKKKKRQLQQKVGVPTRTVRR